MIDYFVIGDTHFFHKNIIEYADRPFADISEMNEAMVVNWNKVVGPYDKVFVVGDVSFGSREDTIEIISRLKGHKILIKGNHDTRSNSFWIEAGFQEVISYPIIFGDYILSHEPIPLVSIGSFINIHAHVHTYTENYEGLYPDKYKCVSVEKIDYTPLKLIKPL